MFIKNRIKKNILNKWELLTVYFAVLSWAIMAVLIYFDISKWLEMLFIDLEFAIITPLFVSYSVARQLKDSKAFENLQFLNAETFEQNLLKYRFSTREKEIIRLIRRGYNRRQVGDKLFIAHSTVSRHLQNIYEKAEVKSMLALISKLEHGNDH